MEVIGVLLLLWLWLLLLTHANHRSRVSLGITPTTGSKTKLLCFSSSDMFWLLRLRAWSELLVTLSSQPLDELLLPIFCLFVCSPVFETPSQRLNDLDASKARGSMSSSGRSASSEESDRVTQSETFITQFGIKVNNKPINRSDRTSFA